MGTLPRVSLEKLKNIAGTGNEEHRRLYATCLEHGFFYLVDHGIDLALIRRTIAASRHFFQLPESIKQAYGQDKQSVFPKTSRGYVPLKGETLHQDVGPDPKEIFDLGIEKPASDQPFTGPTLLPDDNVAPGFAAAHLQLQHEILTKIVPHLLRAFAVALNLKADWFDRYFDDPIVIHRTIYYPPESGIAGKHTDNGIFTVLIQEPLPSPSLRVYTKDTWVEADCPEDAFVINLGDMLSLWTDGLFVSTPHAVVHKLACSRISIPFFIYPNVDTTFHPIGTNKTINATEVMLKNFDSIWVYKSGAGRARELL